MNVLSKSQSKPVHPYLYWEFHERGFDQALRKGKWKAVKRSINGSACELYDLNSDPSENKNLASLYPAVVKEMEKLFLISNIISSTIFCLFLFIVSILSAKKFIFSLSFDKSKKLCLYLRLPDKNTKVSAASISGGSLVIAGQKAVIEPDDNKVKAVFNISKYN